MQITNVECPTCASMLYFDQSNLTYKCQSCGGFFDKGELVTQSLMKRAYFSMKSREYASAFHNFEKFLDKEPNNVFALRGKMMAEGEISDFVELGDNTTSKFYCVDYVAYGSQAPESCQPLFNTCSAMRKDNENFVNANGVANDYMKKSDEMLVQVNALKQLADKDIMKEECTRRTHYDSDTREEWTVVRNVKQVISGSIRSTIFLCILGAVAIYILSTGTNPFGKNFTPFDLTTKKAIAFIVLGVLVALSPLLDLHKPISMIHKHKADVRNYQAAKANWDAFNAEVQQKIQIRDQMLQTRQNTLQKLIMQDQTLMKQSPVK